MTARVLLVEDEPGIQLALKGLLTRERYEVRGLDEFPDGKTYPGLLVMRFDAGLYFGSSDALEDRLRDLADEADPPLHTGVIDFEGINFIDSQGSSKIAEIIELKFHSTSDLTIDVT